MIRAVVSDFRGVLTVVSDFGLALTRPLTGGQAFADQSGIELAAMGQAFAALAELTERDGVHPLHELERGGG